MKILCHFIFVVIYFGYSSLAYSQARFLVIGYEESIKSFSLTASERFIVEPIVDIPLVAAIGEKNANNEIVDKTILAAAQLNILATRIGTTKYVVFEASRAQLDGLLDTGIIKQVSIDESSESHLNYAIPTIAGDYLHSLEIKGLGKVVVILDDGVEATHTSLQSRVIDGACFSAKSSYSESFCPNGKNRELDVSASIPCNVQNCSHGTHVAGIVASDNSKYTGVAPLTKIISIQVFSSRTDQKRCGEEPVPCKKSFQSDQLAALNYIDEKLSQMYPIAAINMSLGSGEYKAPCPSNMLSPIIRSLRNKGIPTVISSGNDAYKNAIGSPSCIEEAISVGAVNNLNKIYSNSNSAYMIDLLAPGDQITSTVPMNKFSAKSGTSMAAPMVSGSIAAFQSYFTVDVDTIENILKSTGLSITTLDPSLAKPRIDLRAAFSALDEKRPPGEFVWMRDTWQDTGKEPDPVNNGKQLSNSPDLWIRNRQGECNQFSQTHQNPEYGQPNFACVKLQNSGKGEAKGKLKLYYAKANFDEVASWKEFGSEKLTIPPQHTVIQEFNWSSLPGKGHYCMIARWLPNGSSENLVFPGGFRRAVRNSNDLIWRNLIVVDLYKNINKSELIFEPGNDGVINMVVDISSMDPEKIKNLGRLVIELGGNPGDLKLEPTSKYYDHEGGKIYIPLKTGTYYIPNIRLDQTKDSKFNVAFEFSKDRPNRERIDDVFVDIVDVDEVAAHKFGADTDGTSIHYVISDKRPAKR